MRSKNYQPLQKPNFMDNGHSELVEIQSLTLKPRWLVISGVVLTGFAASGFAAGFAFANGRIASVTRTQQTQMCHQFNRGEVTAVEIASLGQISGVQEMVTELEKVQIQLAKARIRFTDQAPTVVQLKDQEAGLKSLLQQRLQGICQAVK